MALPTIINQIVEPLPLIELKNGNWVLNEDTKRLVFENSDIRNMEVAILPITGIERGGKSFTLNYFILFLETNGYEVDQHGLKGFKWKGDTLPQTEGVYVWPKPFIKTINNKKIAIILMDTQGCDGKDTNEDAIIVPFCLSVSALQMHNVVYSLNSSNLQTYQNLMKLTSNKEKLFQHLVLIVRNWTLTDKYGFDGGEAYLSQQLIGKDNNTYQFMKSFSSISCFLWPPPGDNVSKSDFNGNLSQLSPQFVRHLKILIPKVIDILLQGTHLKGRELSQRIGDCFGSILKNEPFLSIEELFVSNSLENTISIIINKAKGEFNESIKQLDSKNKQTNPKNLKRIMEIRESILIEAFEQFKEQNDQIGNLYEQKLGKLQYDLISDLNDIEKGYLNSICHTSIRRLKEYNGMELEDFVNASFFGKLFTRKSAIIKKSVELEKTITDELAKYPDLYCLFTEEQIIDFADDRKETLQNLKGRRLKAGASAALSIIFMVTGAVVGGLAVGGAAVVKGGAELGKSAAKGTIEEVTKESAKTTLKSGLGAALGLTLEKFSEFVANYSKESDNKSCKYPTTKERDEKPDPQKTEESDFLVDIKNLLLIIDRYLTIGGDVITLVERVKEEEKKFVKKGNWKLLVS